MKRSFTSFARRLVEMSLRAEVEDRAKSFNVSLRKLYEGEFQAPSIVRARRVIYGWLVNVRGFGVREVARLFDRAPSGIVKMLKGRR